MQRSRSEGDLLGAFVEIPSECAIYENIKRPDSMAIYENVAQTELLEEVEEEEDEDEEEGEEKEYEDVYVDMSRDSAYFSALDLNIGSHSYANVGVWQNLSSFPVRRTYPPFIPANVVPGKLQKYVLWTKCCCYTKGKKDWPVHPHFVWLRLWYIILKARGFNSLVSSLTLLSLQEVS